MQCCYLLTPVEDGTGARTYIGYTVDPLRRLRQHNGDLKSGGAKRTQRWRPWRIVCVVMGFPSRFSALSFEFAWQRPHRGLKTREAMEPFKFVSGLGRHYSVQRKLLELSVLLNVVLPFREFPLHVAFQEKGDFLFFNSLYEKVPPNLGPIVPRGVPRQMRLIQKSIPDAFQEAQQVFAASESSTNDSEIQRAEEGKILRRCVFCERNFETGRPILTCKSEDAEKNSVVDLISDDESVENESGCQLIAHPVCLASAFLENEINQVFPRNEMECPFCCTKLNWAELVRDAETAK